MYLENEDKRTPTTNPAYYYLVKGILMKIYDVVLWNSLNWLSSYHLSVFTEMDSRG